MASTKIVYHLHIFIIQASHISFVCSAGENILGLKADENVLYVKFDYVQFN